MIPFATEIPIKPITTRAKFVAQVFAWLRGTNYSTLLEGCHSVEPEGEMAHLQSHRGEELRLREFGRGGKFEAIGFRHDFPDEDGRLWRTEAVLRRSAASNGQDLIRLRTQCIAKEPGALLETPRKPYFIKRILDDGWSGKDGVLDVFDRPHWLSDGEADLGIAREITLGEASRHLPIIYMSANNASNWLLSRSKIEQLAFELGGVAHIVVEPNRAFSFRLRDETEGSNVYGGTIGIALPERGIVRRLFLDWQLQDEMDLLSAVRSASLAMRSQMPVDGWDWTELQEQALRRQRERDRNRLSAQESEQLYLEEIENLQDRIDQLEELLAARPVNDSPYRDDAKLLPEALINRIGPELYPDEFSDRLRLAVTLACSNADQTNLDRRSKAILDRILENLPLSPALSELLEDLKRATKSPKRLSSEVKRLLLRHGYRIKSEKRHVRLEATDEYVGLMSVTIPKSPSDKRSLINSRKQIEKALGIANLSE